MADYEYNEHQRAYGHEDVMAVLCGAGFDSIAACADWERTPATPEAFFIYLCRRER